MFHGFEVRMVHHEGDGGKDGKSRQTALPAELANALADLVRKHADPNLGVDLRGNRLLFLSRDGRLLKGIREAFANPIDEPVTRG